MNGITDLRRWDFTILDDEVLDDPRLSTGARAAYWSIARHSRLSGGQTDEPSERLMRGAGIKKRPTWRRVRAELESLSLIRVQMRPRRTPVIFLLAVQKLRPKPAPYRQGVVPPSGPPVGPKRAQQPVPKRPIPITTPRSGEGEKNGHLPAMPEQGPDSERLRAFRERLDRFRATGQT